MSGCATVAMPLAESTAPQRHRICTVSVLLTFFLFPINTWAQTPLFTAQPPVTVGTNPQGVVTADFNHDGNADVAVSDYGSNTITILLGNGHGAYSPAAAISGSMSSPQSLATADFNGDGKPDLVVANPGNNTITIWLGNGDGTFALASGSPITVGSNPSAVVVGDFNHDGKPDVAVANKGSQTMSILLGNGSGGFSSAPGSPITGMTNNPFALAVADFNRDGKLDIASVGEASNDLWVFLGNGDGTFQSHINSGGLSQPEGAIAVGDFNKDGIPDVAVSDEASGRVAILLGNGAGKFTAASGSPISVGVRLYGLVAGDFNRDGNPDFAVADNGSNNVRVFLGQGNGSFTAATGSPFAVGQLPYGLAAGDFSGHGGLDLVVTNEGSNTITFLFNSSTPGPIPPLPTTKPTLTTLTSTPNPASFGLTVIFTAFVTGAGGTPTGTVTFYDGAALLPLGTGTVSDGFASLTENGLAVGTHEISATYSGDTNFAGSSSDPLVLRTGAGPDSVATADFNRDGLLDLAIPNASDETVSIFLNNGHGFSLPSTLALPVLESPQSEAVGDFNGDGKPDLAVVTLTGLSGELLVALGNGDGTFTLSTPADTGRVPRWVVAGDFNRDGKLDVAVTNFYDSTVTVLLGDGTGNFSSSQTVTGVTGPGEIVASDFNKDGKLDLAIMNDDTTVSILLGDGNGGFTPAAGSPVSAGDAFAFALAAADFNGDGNPDIAVVTVTGQLIVLLGNGAGGFTMAAGSPITVGGDLETLNVGDFNGDGKVDLAATDIDGSVFHVLLGDGTGGFTPALGMPPATGSFPFGAALGDFNGDGKLDLVSANYGDNTATVLLGYGNGQFQEVLEQTTLGGPGVDLSPPSDFGDQAVGTLSAPQFITLNNSGTGALTIISIAVSAPFENDIRTTTCSGTVPVGSSCLIAIKFAPTAVGLVTGTLSVVDNAEDSPQTAALMGTGVAAAPTLMLSGPTFVNNTLTYGSQEVTTTSPAQTLVVTNSGSATLTVTSVTATTEFGIAGGSCGTAAFNLDAGASCELTVTFTPSATGTRTGTLTLIHNAAGSPAVVTLTGTGISAGVGLSPSAIAFGTQVVGTTSGPQSTTLTNTGAAPLSVTALAASGDFALSSPDCATLPVTLQPNGVCTLVVTFGPTAAGVRTGTVTITDGLGQQFVSLTGDGAAPGVQLTPANLDFGSQTVGTTSAEQTATLTNTGTSSLQVDSFIAAGDFAMTSPDCATLPVTLAPGQVCTLELNFTPTAAGIRTGLLGVTTSASASQQFVVLEGIGNAPGLTLSPSNLDFGSQLVSTESPAQTITLTNSGTSSLVVNTFKASGDFAVSSSDCPTLPVTLAPSTGTCTLAVTFTPASAGARTGTLTVTSTASGGQAFADLDGSGTPPGEADLDLEPANLLFGSEAVGTTSMPQVVVVTSTGTTAVTIDSFAASGDFAVSSADCPTTPATLQPGAICTLSVTFTPTGTGGRTGTLTLSSTAPGGQRFVPLEGSGIAPVVVLTPPNLVFGTETIGSISATQTVVLQNTGSAALTVNSFTAIGPFAVSSPDCPTLPATLPAGTGQCSLAVTFSPTVVGLQYGAVVIADSSSDGQHVVTLTGYGGAPGTTVTPANVIFGSQPLGTVSAPQSVTLTNTGTAAIGVSNIAATASFQHTSSCPASLPGGGSCTISVSFAPTTAGTTAGAALASTDNGVAFVGLLGTGAGPELMLSGPTLVNNTLTYGSQAVETTSPAQTLIVTNSGASTLSVSSVAVTTDFTIAGGSCGATGFNLDPGASCDFTVTFAPSAAGTRTGTLSLTHNAPGSPAVVALTGTGISAGVGVGLSPSAIAFGTQVVGTTSGPQSTTLTNTGTAPFSVTALAASGDFALSSPDCATLPVTLQPNGVCTLLVTFSPTAAGVRTGTVTITDDLGQQFASLTGDGAAPGVQLTPANLDFGSQTVNTTSAEQTVTLTNTGTSSLQVDSFNVAGDFAMTSPNCATLPAVLAPGQVCTLGVNFTPTATGIRTGFVGVTTSASASQQFVVLEGIGNAPGLTLSPSNQDFGSQLVSTTSPAQIILLTNSGTSSLLVNTIKASGDFAVSSSDCPTLPATLAPSTGKCTLAVTFAPAAAGTRTGTLTVTSTASGGQAFADLDGFGASPGAADLDLEPGNLLFGSQAVGTTSVPQVVVATGTGTSAVTIDSFAASGDFAVSSADCPATPATLQPGAICTLSVTFTPTGSGGRTGTLTINSTAPGGQRFVSLEGSGIAPVAVLTPPSLLFGTQTTGSTSPAQTAVLQNTGSAALTVNGFTVSGPFAVSSPDCPTLPATLPAGTGQCSLAVTFSPTVVGLQYGDVVIASIAGEQVVTLLGHGGAPGTTVTPANVIFGSQPVGTVSAPQNVTLTNTGTAAIGVTNIAATANFQHTNTCPASLPGGGSCTISVSFAPTTAGTTAGAALASTDSGVEVVGLLGTGGGPTIPAVNLTPASLNFGSLVVGTNATAQTVTLTNNSGGTLQISSLTVSGDFTETDNCGKSVAPGAGCAITVGFKPTTSGTRTGTLSVSDNASGSPHTASLTGVGQDFALGPFNLSQTVPAGVSTSYYLQLTPLGGFSQQVTMACSGAPQNATCTAAPSSATLNGLNNAAFALRVATTAPSVAGPVRRWAPKLPQGLRAVPWEWQALLALLLLGGTISLARGRIRVVALAAVLALVLAWVACGSSSAPPPHTPTGGTPAGTYTLTVTATSGSLTHSLTVQLIVQ
jgi:hypothetical protein